MINGIIGKKLGMTQIFQEDGSLMGVTAIEAGPCTILQVKTTANDGYEAVQLGFGVKKRGNKPEKGHAKGQGPFEALREFKLGSDDKPEVGQKVDAGIFKVGDTVDIIATSRGFGFQGGVRRYHFRGGPKTHGQSDRHRAPGSIGSGTTPGHVQRGLRMAGRYGGDRVTVQNVKVVRVEPERNLLLLNGAVPGAKNQIILLRHATKAKAAKAKA